MKRLYKGEVEVDMEVIVKGFKGLSEDPLKVYMVFEEEKINFRVGEIGGENKGVAYSRWGEDGFEVWQVNDECPKLEEKCMKFNGNICVKVLDRIELARLTTFFRKVTDGERDCFGKPDSNSFPIVAYCRGEKSYDWGWNRSEDCSLKSVLLEEFLVEYDVSDECVVKGSKVENTEKSWSATHYDVNYTLSEKEKEVGFIRLDTYKVNKAWKMNDFDATGCGFHILKTVNRIPRNKNPLERELRAIIGQAKCWANEESIDLSDLFK